ncbi:MAG: sigma factor [Polyangiaceae bacterium]
MTRLLMRVLGAEREIADLKHDVFVRALSSIDKLSEPGALRGWLTSITVFCGADCRLAESRRR